MFGNMSIKNRLISLSTIFLITFIGINIYINTSLNGQKQKFDNMKTVVEIRGGVVGTLTSGLQITSALRGVYINPKDKKTLANLEKAIVTMDKQINKLNSTRLRNLSKGIDKFNVIPLFRAYQNDINRLIGDAKNGKLTDKAIITHIVNVWRPLKKQLKAWRDASKKKDIEFVKSYEESNNSILTYMLILSVIGFIFIAIYSYLVINSITNSLIKVQNGISSFFDFLNRKTSSAKKIGLNTNDEFGKMAKDIDNNIGIIEKSIQEDNEFINDTQSVMARVQKGWFSQHIRVNTSNPNLIQLKETVNTALSNLKLKFEEINAILDEYVKLDYRRELKIDGIEKGGVFDSLLTDIVHLRAAITKMLVENKQNGMTLDNSSDILLKNVDTLNKNANQSAASLEETAAAIEEITSSIANNSTNVNNMSRYATSVSDSANEGQRLANETTKAMEEINEEVTSINEAISVIDQIAFQTNILSLNAAVEAATAGEAGKGFAVVAQEVRNLASRSAEAANEIKTLVENATQKANNGKHITDKMIEGYTQLSDNIIKTNSLINDIENASKEQKNSIEQINNAISTLDKQTQHNAQIASQAQEVAIKTDEIAKLVVSNANAKEFVGK